MDKFSGILIIQDIEANLTSKKIDKNTVLNIFFIFKFFIKCF